LIDEAYLSSYGGQRSESGVCVDEVDGFKCWRSKKFDIWYRLATEHH
jgi:hypothetical protein